MKTAFLFPGQGSQYVGMGKKLMERFPVARETLAQVDEVLGVSLSQIILEGPESELAKTANTQPALLSISVAYFRVLEEAGLRPDLVAGHSLGEYSALVAAGALSLTDACRLVRTRGKLMQEAVPLGQGAMAALMGMEHSKAQELIAEAKQSPAGELAGVLAIAGCNSPGQVVISGDKALVDKACEVAVRWGFRKPALLNVSAPFHCPLMKPVENGLKPLFDEISITPLRLPYVANATAEIINEKARVSRLLLDQICLPVLWQQSVEKMWGEGIRRFVEVGPGKVLSGLVKRSLPAAAKDDFQIRSTDLSGDLDESIRALI